MRTGVHFCQYQVGPFLAHRHYSSAEVSAAERLSVGLCFFATG